MTQTRDPVSGRWARLRFSIVGQLLMAPPPRGGLKPAIEALAGQEWQHPVSGERVRFGASTIERWYYAAQAADQDPVSALFIACRLSNLTAFILDFGVDQSTRSIPDVLLPWFSVTRFTARSLP